MQDLVPALPFSRNPAAYFCSSQRTAISPFVIGTQPLGGNLPVCGSGWVGNHDGLQMKAPIRNKYDGIHLLLQHRRCAPQHLPCTPILHLQAGHNYAMRIYGGILKLLLRRGLGSTWGEGPALRHREAGKERGQLLPHGLERGCKLDGACQCKLLLGLKVQPEADGMLVTSSTGNLSTCLQSRLGCAKCYLQIWRCIVGWQSQEDSNPGEAHLMVSTRWCMSIWMSTKT